MNSNSGLIHTTGFLSFLEFNAAWHLTHRVHTAERASGRSSSSNSRRLALGSVDLIAAAVGGQASEFGAPARALAAIRWRACAAGPRTDVRVVGFDRPGAWVARGGSRRPAA
jgi:hypothetical protein